MADWIPIRVKTEQSKMRYVQARIAGYPEEAFNKYYFQAMQSAVASAVDVQKNFIEYDRSVFTRSGQERKQRGGNGPGRKDTGAMIAGIAWEGKKDSAGKYRFRFGWINGTPGYSIFQEQGTKNGVKAMNSLGYATEFLRNELLLMGNNRKGFRVTRASRWSGMGSSGGSTA